MHDDLDVVLHQNGALIENRDLARDHPDELHVMLDHDERLGPVDVANKLDSARHLLVGHAGRGLVKQNKIGVGGQHHAEFDPLTLSMRQLANEARSDGCEPYTLKHGVDRCARLRPAMHSEIASDWDGAVSAWPTLPIGASAYRK